MSERKKFTLYTEPHVAEIGDQELEFRPEVYADETLDAWVDFRTKLDAARADDDNEERSPEETKERTKKVTQATREFLASYMTTESQERFKGMRVPERVLLELERWVMEIYGQRPTTSSSDSSTQSSATASSTSTSSTSEGGSTP